MTVMKTATEGGGGRQSKTKEDEKDSLVHPGSSGCEPVYDLFMIDGDEGGENADDGQTDVVPYSIRTQHTVRTQRRPSPIPDRFYATRG